MAPRKPPTKVRGVYERDPGSGIWWICYKQGTVRKREKVGPRGAAIELYRQRKTELRTGAKLAPNLRNKGTKLSELAADALAWSAEHHPKDIRTVTGRMKTAVEAFGALAATEITPQMIDRWLTEHEHWSPATKNRYRALISLIYRQAMRNGKADLNPARSVAARVENNSRVRFLTFDEEDQIREVIRRRCPVHEPDFTIALETGMRLSEQHTLEWSNVNLDRGQIKLLETKNGSSRVVILTEEALAALKVCLLSRNPITPRVFLTRYGKPMQNPRAWFKLVMAEAIESNPALSDVTWHVFRHTFISRLVMAGVGLKEVQELAGHKTLSMTNRYAHLSPEHKQKAVQQLSAYRRQEAGKRTVLQIA